MGGRRCSIYQSFLKKTLSKYIQLEILSIKLKNCGFFVEAFTKEQFFKCKRYKKSVCKKLSKRINDNTKFTLHKNKLKNFTKKYTRLVKPRA